MFCLITIAILYYLYKYLWVPVPPNTGNPFKYRVFATLAKIFEDLCMIHAWWTGRDRGLVLQENMAYFLRGTKHPDVKVTEETFDGVQVFIYQRHGTRKNRPGMMFYHGGGFLFGHPVGYEPLYIEFVKKHDIVIVSPRYRLSCYAKVPVQHEDCKTATNYFFENAEKYGVNPKLIVSVGDSAGGNLAASMCLIMKEQKKHQFAFQVLIYPWVQALDNNSPSRQQNSPKIYRFLDGWHFAFYLSYFFGVNSKYIADIRDNKHVDEATWNKYKAYMNIDDIPAWGIPHDYKPIRPTDSEINKDLTEKIKTDLTNPHYFPLCADDLSDLPPAFVLVVENDPIRDDSTWYAKRLERSGVKVTTYHSNGFHGMMNALQWPRTMDAALKGVEEINKYMGQYFDQ